MALKTFVKVSGVNNLSDARYCAGMGVNIIGFEIDEQSENYTSPEKFSEITGWLAGVAFAGELEAITALGHEKILEKYQLDYLQVSHEDQLQELRDVGLPIIFRVQMQESSHLSEVEGLLKKYQNAVTYFLFETDTHATGSLLEITLQLAERFPILLGFGFDEGNIRGLINTSAIKGISLTGGKEMEPGLNEFDRLAGILEKLETEETGY